MSSPSPAASEAPAPAAPSAFGYRDFRLFWFSRLTGSLAVNMTAVAVGWQVYEIARQSHSIKEASLYLGLIGLVQFVTLAGCSLVAGYISDRFDRRWIARGALSVDLLSIGLLFAHARWGDQSLLPIFMAASLLGIGRAFMAPSMQALAPNLVPVTILPSAIAWNSIAWQIAAIGGPAACGYLIAGGAAWVYGTCLALLTVSLTCISFIRPVAQTPRTAGRPLRAILDGLSYIRTNRMVLGAISLDLFAVLLGGATAMLPVYARDILAVGPEGLGNLRAAPAVGAALVALVLTRFTLRNRVGLWMFACVGVYGLATAIFGLSTSYTLSLAMLGVLGAADMISVYVRSSLIQIHTPDDMRGRVASVSTLFISASNELGEFQSGIVARLIGAVPAVVVGGVGAIVVTVLWAMWFPELRKANRLATESSRS
ncbi:MFS transporter [Parapedomonas caeni]